MPTDPSDTARAPVPLFALRLTIGETVLTPAVESDLGALAAILPADVQQDPAAEHLSELDWLANRRRVLVQEVWQAWATFGPAAWQLPFAVRHRGRLVGLQTLEATQFPQLRTVDSASWLTVEARGRGLGTQMRCAVLALAFDHLGATAAISSAEPGNHASLGVSARLGYRHNGVSTINSPSGPVIVQHVRLTADQWHAGAAERSGVGVTGLDPGLAWFGISAPRSD